MGVPWGRLGIIWGALGGFLRSLGVLLGALGGLWGSFGSLLGVPGGLWGVPRRSCRFLGASGTVSGIFCPPNAEDAMKRYLPIRPADGG